MINITPKKFAFLLHNEYIRHYPIVKTGSQYWMKATLKTTKFYNGTSISNVTDNNTWGNLTTGACCWYNNDSAYKTNYGALYNWCAVSTGNYALQVGMCTRGRMDHAY